MRGEASVVRPPHGPPAARPPAARARLLAEAPSPWGCSAKSAPGGQASEGGTLLSLGGERACSIL
eukprot:5863102-Prymnesium_polylepis.1